MQSLAVVSAAVTPLPRVTLSLPIADIDADQTPQGLPTAFTIDTVGSNRKARGESNQRFTPASATCPQCGFLVPAFKLFRLVYSEFQTNHWPRTYQDYKEITQIGLVPVARARPAPSG